MEPNAQIHLFNSHIEAEEAIRELERAGFDIKKLSIVGKGYHTEEHAVGFYGVADRIKSWGGMGAFWGAIWGLLLTPAVFFLPSLGLVAMAGPVVATLITALEGAVVVGGLSGFGAVLVELGVPHEQAIKYETAIRSDKYVLMIHGSTDEIHQAQSILNHTIV